MHTTRGKEDSPPRHEISRCQSEVVGTPDMTQSTNLTWRETNAITDWEHAEIGGLLCDHRPKDLALMVVRLRARLQICEQMLHRVSGTPHAEEAADEIERLRGALRGIVSSCIGEGEMITLAHKTLQERQP